MFQWIAEGGGGSLSTQSGKSAHQPQGKMYAVQVQNQRDAVCTSGLCLPSTSLSHLGHHSQVP